MHTYLLLFKGTFLFIANWNTKKFCGPTEHLRCSSHRFVRLKMKENLWVFLTVIFLYLRCCACEKKCTSSGVLTPRNFYVGEHDLSFRIEVSKRTGHHLVSHVARILLREALGYDDVVLVEHDHDDTMKTLQKISSCEKPDLTSCKDENEKGPDIMINLELWLSPGFNLERWVNTHRIEDCGPLGPVGRVGWYVDKRIVELMWSENGTIVDHYKAFLKPEVTAAFDLSSDPTVLDNANKTYHRLKEPAKYSCSPDGLYRPPQCTNTQVKCATILADYPESSFTLLKRIILRYRLFVNIAWMGEQFEDTLSTMIGNDKRKVLFFHSKPMILSAIVNVTHVSFPNCEDDIRQCEFEVNQLQKVVWSEIKISAPHVYQVIRAISFTQEQYIHLLDNYYKSQGRKLTYEMIACEWLNENTVIWSEWIPEEAPYKANLYIGGIFPITGVYWNQNAVVEAAEMAADAINRNDTLLVKYNLKILEEDGHCATDEVMKSFIQYVKSEKYKSTIGILGPACSDTVEPIAGVANHFNTIIMSYSAEGTLFNNQEKYRFFFRTIPENNLFRYVFVKLFQKLGYTRLAALTEDGQKYPEYLSYLQVLMKSHQMTFIENRKFPRVREFSNMSMYLEDLNKKGARIIIGDFYDYAARSVMCTAYKLRMIATNGYVWFLPSWFPSDWYDTDKKNKLSNGTAYVPCTTEEMAEAINGHMSLSYKFYADSHCYMQENITVKEWRENYKRFVNKEKKVPSSYGGYAYDAVWVYALALDKLLKENAYHVATLHTTRTSRRFVELLRETHFDGVTGPLFFQNGSRISDVLVWQWLNGSRHLIGIYKATSPDDGELELNITEIKWLTPNGQQPDDGSRTETEECEVEALRLFLGGVKCGLAKIIANVIGVVCFIFVVGIGIVIYKRRYDKRLRNTEKRMFGLLANYIPYKLDKWELPRERIVINRKLGEGAFGTVYGGEAFVGNAGWIPVAVKTLKSGSKMEEKLDFLGEAEVMKKFDHINIVKLVGVSTTEEPVYTVMEFMLYGDLKNYLLSRRHMVYETETNEEICNRRLTNMALDIARGLSYLADLKYVHRDLACRNCLVNTSRSVKIADFGLCRAMFDSDYYRYSKKGFLPIRWMAPESLIDGLFTPMSDVWSYGVVLYEIITFGSYPYQGFSHEQVLTHVKSCRTLPVPKGCKPALETLLHQCWASNPQRRPPAAAVVEYLAKDPEMLTPCLDVPTASIDLEDPDTLDVKTLDRVRGHSFSSVWQTRKNAVPLDPNNLGYFDTSHIFHFDTSQAGLETSLSLRQSRYKHLNKKSFHESFKKSKRDLCKGRTSDVQVTYL